MKVKKFNNIKNVMKKVDRLRICKSSYMRV